MLTIFVSIMSLTLNFSLILSHGFSLSLFRLQLSLLFSESISIDGDLNSTPEVQGQIDNWNDILG